MSNKAAEQAAPQPTWERAAVFGFGVLFCAVLAYAGLRTQPIGSQQFFFLRVLSAISAAGVAALVPGFIKVDIKSGTRLAVSAGGAMAVFLIIYLVNPPDRVHQQSESAAPSASPPPVTSPLSGPPTTHSMTYKDSIHVEGTGHTFTANIGGAGSPAPSPAPAPKTSP